MIMKSKGSKKKSGPVKTVKTVKRDTEEYTEGFEAFNCKYLEKDCPYQIGSSKRTGWFTGYYDRKYQIQFGPILKKWNMTWP